MWLPRRKNQMSKTKNRKGHFQEEKSLAIGLNMMKVYCCCREFLRVCSNFVVMKFFSVSLIVENCSRVTIKY